MPTKKLATYSAIPRPIPGLKTIPILKGVEVGTDKSGAPIAFLKDNDDHCRVLFRINEGGSPGTAILGAGGYRVLVDVEENGEVLVNILDEDGNHCQKFSVNQVGEITFLPI